MPRISFKAFKIMLNISIVLYLPDWQQVISLTEVMLQCKHINHVYWIDNSPTEALNPPLLSPKISYQHSSKNLGYGAGHNIAIRESIYDNIPFHLVINSDILLPIGALDSMLEFMAQHPEIGSLMPKVTYPNGELQHLCKLLPTPLDVFGRRFL